MATGSWSGTKYLKDGVTLTVKNPSKENITSMTFKIVTAAQSGGAYHHSYAIVCTTHGGYVQCETDGTGSYTWYLTTTSGFSGASDSVTFDLSYDNNFIAVSSISLSDYTVATVHNNTIYYYLGSDYYKSDTEASFDTISSFTLLEVPSNDTDYTSWENGFTITGKANGGKQDSSLTAQTRIKYVYSYTGWYKGSISGDYLSPGSTKSLSDGTKLYAKVSKTPSTEYQYNTLASLTEPSRNSDKVPYTVTFEPNGGTVNPKSKQATKTIPYVFSHWSSDASGGTSYKKTQAFTSATTVYAQWSEDTNNITISSITLPTPSRTPSYTYRTVTFNANGGSCDTKSLVSTNTTTYPFKNWEDTSGNTYNAGDSYTPSKSITLTAQWTPSSTGYKAITLPTATRTGYSFNGWKDNSSGNIYPAGTSYTPPSDKITLTASWYGQTYEVKYNGNGHTYGSMNNSIHTIGVETELSKNGYIKEYILSFDSIHIENTENNTSPSLLPSEYTQLEYIEANYNQCLDTGYNFKTNNVKVYMEYTNLNTNGVIAYSGNKVICGAEDDTPSTGRIDMCGGSLYTAGSAESFTFDIGDGASKLHVNIPREQKLTIEINCTSDSTNYSTYSISINGQQQDIQSATACFRNQYNYYVFADNQFGTPNMPSAGYLYRFTMYDNDFSNPVRDFIPCKRNSDNAIGVYDLIEKNFHQSITNTSFVAGNEINSDNDEDEIITYDGIKVTYSHDGWYSNSSCKGDPITQALDLTTAGKVYNVYAKWIQNDFTLPIPPEKEGYTFLGWYDSQGNRIVDNSPITSDLALTAQWIKNETNKKIIIYTNNDWKKAIALIYKNNTWKEYDFNIK